jgi:hypothetical protein
MRYCGTTLDGGHTLYHMSKSLTASQTRFHVPQRRFYFMRRAHSVLAGSVFNLKLYTPSTWSSSTKSLNLTLNVFMISITRRSTNIMSTLLLSHCRLSLSLWHLLVYPSLKVHSIMPLGINVSGSVLIFPSDRFRFGTLLSRSVYRGSL